MQREYWSALNQTLASVRGPISSTRLPQPQHWMNFGLGRAGFQLGAAMIRPRREVRAEVYIDKPDGKLLFRQLEHSRSEIERELGCALEWNELPGRRACRISNYLRPADANDRTDWPRQHQWLARTLNDLHRVFAPRIRVLETTEASAIDDADLSQTAST